MIVKAKKDRELILIYAQNTQNENRAEIITLDVPEQYESFNKKIVFITDDGTVWDVIQNNEYKITNAITKYKQVDFYIWLTKEVNGESIDFRSKTKTLKFYDNIDASDEITPEEIHGVNTVVNILEEEIDKVENLNISAERVQDGVEISITDKEGVTTVTKVNDGADGQDGQDGEDGKDAKINGRNSIEIEAGQNITIDNIQNGIRINSTAESGTLDYGDLENKPKINNVELNGSKSLNDLGIQPKGNYLTTETDPTVPSHVKNITQENITSWNNKSDFSGSYNDLINKPTIPSEVTETTVSNWGFTKNTGTYSKPSGGIPATDLTTSVQATLTKADNQVWYGTQAQYDVLSPKNPNTLYCIVED